MAEVASAFVSLVPSARGFGPGTERQIGGEVAAAGKNLGRTLGKTMFLTAAAVGGAIGIGNLFSSSIGEAREAQKVGALTAQVIKTTGGAARVTARQIGTLATAISNKVGIDDEQIQSGANMLLTFKNIRNQSGKNNKIFNQATRITTDMAAAMAAASGGQIDLKSSSIQVGKALNDPVKGITALGRVGVTFTKGQKDQIKALVDSGKTMGAQKIILKELKSEFGGAASSMATNGDKAKVALGNLKEQLGTAMLPVVDRLAKFFTNRLAPALSNIIQNIAPVGRKLRRFFSQQVAPVLSTLGGMLATATTAVQDFFTSGDGGSALKSAIGFVSDSAGKVRDGFAEAASSLSNMKDAAQNFDFGNLDSKQIGKALGTAVVQGLQFLGKSVGKITKTLGDMFGKVDWVGIGIMIGRQAPALLLGLAAGLLNFDFGSLLRGIGDHWFDILMGVLILAFAPSKFIGPLERILTRIPFVGRFLAVAVRWLNDLGGKLVKFGGDLFRSFAEGFGRVRFPGAGIVSKVLGAFKMLPARLLNFWVTLQVRMGVWALDAFAAAGRGARAGIGALFRLVGTIGRRVLAGLGDLGKLLFDAGRTLIDGLIRGITSKLKDVGKAMGKVAGKIKGFLPGSPVKEGPLTSWNKGGAGKRLVGTLVTGIDAKRPEAGDAMMRLTRGLNTFAVAPRVDASVSGRAGAVSGGAQFNVESVYAQDVNDFLRQMQVRSRQAALGGVPR